MAALGSWTGQLLEIASVNVGCKTDPLRRGGLGALAALCGRCPTLTAGPRGPGSTRTARTAQWPRDWKSGCSRALASAFATRTGPYLNVDSFFPCSAGCFGIMAQRAFLNPYADYNKSLAEGYFDSAGRVSLGSICLHPYLQTPVFERSSILPERKG